MTIRTAKVSETILIVDDDVPVAQSVALVLEDAGYATRQVHDARAAAEAMRTDPPDACIFDVWLDGDDGLALAEEARARGLPLVVMSGGGPGRSLESVTAKADALGAAAMLFKPFDDDELTDAVARALGA